MAKILAPIARLEVRLRRAPVTSFERHANFSLQCAVEEMHRGVALIMIFHVIAALLMSLDMRSGSADTPTPHKTIKLRAYGILRLT